MLWSRAIKTQIVEVDGIPVEITKKLIKNFTIRIYPPDGAVKVSAPARFSNQLIRRNIEEKKAWIHEQRERFQAMPRIMEPVLQTGSTIEFLGSNYLVHLTEHYGPSHLTLQDDVLHCYVKHNATEAEKKALLDRWYKRQMEALLPDLINHWSSIVGVHVAEWGLRSMKTRWGSCNIQARRIWLNLTLMKKPQICLEYVLVHELVHLLEASHNQRFYNLMSRFMPDWRHHQILLEGRQPSNEPSY